MIHQHPSFMISFFVSRLRLRDLADDFSSFKTWRPWLLFLLITQAYPLVAQSSLSELAAPKQVFIGNLISNGHLDDPATFRDGLADAHLREEYNTVALENYMKMSFVLPTAEPENIHDLTVEQLRATLTETNIEAFLGNPDWADLRKRGHAMIWFNQAPDWLNLVGPTWTGQQVFSFSRKYILALGQICGDRVDEWDVINEAISDDAPNGQRIWRQGTWYRRANDGSTTDWGEATYENYVKMLFVWAREAQPNARLHLNDYGIETFNNSLASKNRFMRDQAKALKECGAPIDGVGFQSHLTLSDMVSTTGVLNTGFIDLIEQSIQDLATADIEVAITELDIRICNEDRAEAFQETAYRAYCEMALSQPNCNEVLIWGLRDEDNWITLRNDQFFAGCQDAAIVEGDNYAPKAAYDGVADAITALPDRADPGFAPLVAGNGAPANCGGTGSIIPDILRVAGPPAVAPGEQVSVAVNYLASGNQDVVVWFQLDEAPFTVFSQVVVDVTAGSGTINAAVDIPMNVAPGDLTYRYLAFITPDGEGFDGLINEALQNRVSVLGEDSQLIISAAGPESVTQGDTAEVAVRYSAVEGQEIVVWFQLDEAPFTTFTEFRQTANEGLNEIVAKLFVPLSVPAAEDAYQYQAILVPTGGGWPERVSNVNQPNVDVLLLSNLRENNRPSLELAIFPNPTTDVCTLTLPPSSDTAELLIYGATGQLLQRQSVRGGVEQLELSLAELPAGLYWVSLRRGTDYGMTRLIKQ